MAFIAPTADTLAAISSWDDAVRAVGLQPRAGAALLAALDIEVDDAWSTIAMCPETLFWESLRSWTWKDPGPRP